MTNSQLLPKPIHMVPRLPTPTNEANTVNVEEYINKDTNSMKVESSSVTTKPQDNSPVKFKFDEDHLIMELQGYIMETYKEHYVDDNGVQAMDIIMSSGHGAGFSIGNIIKYAARYGKKNGYNREDILKLLHYAVFLLYAHDREHKK